MIVLDWAKVGRRLTEDRKQRHRICGAFVFWYTGHMPRLLKQFIYGGVFLATVASVIWAGYRFLVPAPVCTDGVQNGREEAVDCGVVCGILCAAPVQPLENKGVQLIHYGNGSYDAVAHLENPNAAYGALRVDYTLKVVDAAGAELLSRRGRTYVNPAQPRYLVFPLTGVTGQPAGAELQFNSADVQWGALNVDQAGTVQFPVRREQLEPASNSFRYEATATNRSNFDFDQVDVTVLLSDDVGTLVGAGTTILKTVIAGEERAFVVDWPFAIPNAVRVQAVVTTNIFDNANYIRAYGSQEQFQGF
jgi:hypothetical protein